MPFNVIMLLLHDVIIFAQGPFDRYNAVYKYTSIRNGAYMREKKWRSYVPSR